MWELPVLSPQRGYEPRPTLNNKVYFIKADQALHSPMETPSGLSSRSLGMGDVASAQGAGGWAGLVGPSATSHCSGWPSGPLHSWNTLRDSAHTVRCANPALPPNLAEPDSPALGNQAQINCDLHRGHLAPCLLPSEPFLWRVKS